MPQLYYLCLILLMLSFPSGLMAQHHFTDGCIAYTVHMEPEEGHTGMGRHSGTYRIYIRSRMIRKELELENGFRSVLIWDGSKKTGHSLQSAGDRKYAVQLTRRDMEATEKAYLNFILADLNQEVQSIAGQQCQPAMVTYTNGGEAAICYSRDWKLTEQSVYDWLPGISFLPLSFEIRNEAGVLMRFQADYLLAAPMERSLFRVPAGYHIISNEEYRKLSR